MEHLVVDSRRSLFALNRCYAKLRIMDVKLRFDLFNTLVRSTTNYVYGVWVDSKNIETIEIVYWRFFKSLLGVQNKTNRSIVLAKSSKFPFKHFVWRQMLLYYKHVSTIIKDCILGKTWKASSLCLLREKNVGLDPCWVIQELASRAGRFFASGSIVIGNDTLVTRSQALW
jgi:hypothetical protein